MNALFRKLQWLAHRDRREADVQEELAFHLSEEAEARKANGISDEQAQSAARRELGNVVVIAEDVRAAWTWPRGERVLQDLRSGLRGLRRSPGFTLTVVVTLAIGIGATSAIFSVINGVLLKPLPFPEPGRLIALVHQAKGANQTELGASQAIYFTYREHNRTFESVALWNSTTASVTASGHPEEVQTLASTHEFLPTLGVNPLLGRTFSEADDQPGSPATVILAYGYWQRRFGGAGNVIGRTLMVDGAPHEIIGVLPQGFPFLQQPAEILTPARPNRALAFVPSIEGRGIARLKEGVTLAEASADVARMIPILIDTFPVVPGLTRDAVEDMQLGPNLRSLKQHVVGDLDDVLWVLMGTMGLLLLVACANVANLHLVRTEARGQELAIRAALGAGGGAIARSLLVESVLLGLLGGAVGLALATASLPVLLSMAAQELPSVLEVAIDPTVVVFTIAISLGSGLLFGLVSVVKHARTRISATLSGTGRSYSPTRERHRARHSLVVVQVALTLVLLVASGLMIRTFRSLRDLDPGFTDPGQIQTVRIEIPESAVREFDRVIRVQNDIQDRLSELAGVESVGFATRVPILHSGPTGPFSLQGRPDGSPIEVVFRYTSPRFFQTLGTPMLAGRDFEWADHYGGRQVVIVSQSLARRAWGSPAAALGKRLRRSADNPWLEVVGVAGDIRHNGLDRPAPDAIYMTSSERLAQFMGRTVSFFIRGERVGTAGFLDDVERAIWSVNGTLAVGSAQTLGDVYQRSMARTSLTLVLLSITGAMALSLGLVGIYAVIGYVLAERRRELGVRMALGAQHAALKRMLLSQVLLLVVVGMALGLGGAAALTRLMQSLLFGVNALDPATYVVVSVLLLVTAALAGYLPARRVTRIDPIRALRGE
jgi:predicted permease